MKPSIAKFYHSFVQKTRKWENKVVLEQLEKNQWLPVETIKSMRFDMLKKLLQYSEKNVPYYRSLWKKIGFSYNDIKEEVNISELPIINKNTLRENYDTILSEKDPNHEIWVSSGSTGNPFPFRLDKNTITYNVFGALTRGRHWWNFNYGQPEGMIWSGLSDTIGTMRGRFEAKKRRFSWSLKNIKLIDVYGLDDSTIAHGYSVLVKHKPVALRTISSGLYRFCVGLQKLGLDGKKIGAKGAIYTGEGLSDSQIKLIEQVLDCKAICEYGCTELGIIGFECPKGNIHLSSDNLLCEFIRDGKLAVPGELAELIITNLNNYAAPLIRYSIGDFVVPSNKICECGRTLPVIKSVEGRTHDTIRTPDGKIVNGLFFSHLFDNHTEVHQFQVIQENLHTLILELVAYDQLTDRLKSNIKNIVENKFGPEVKINVKQVADIPVLPSGKTPWIISKIPINS